MNKLYLLILPGLFAVSGCKKGFLDEKPSSSIINPTTLAEYQNLLDNSNVLNKTGALQQIASDEYYIVDRKSYDALPDQVQKNTYTWQADPYGGETQIPDWSALYTAVFYSNSVLDGIQRIPVSESNRAEWNRIRGYALFYRSYAFYDLARTFCPVYDEVTAGQEPGLPLRSSAGVDVNMPRASLKATYGQLINDLRTAESLIDINFQPVNKGRPSKAAVLGLLARIYLSMGKYAEAGQAAEKCLSLYDRLIDYNGISTTSQSPFANHADETIFSSIQVVYAPQTTAYTNKPAIAIDSSLYRLYAQNDLRRKIYFLINPIGNINLKRGYVKSGYYPFTGLATDEMMLISAECQARQGNISPAMKLLRSLLVKRYHGEITDIPEEIGSAAEAVDRILKERRKELIWRGLRWSDLKRLNKEGAAIRLNRTLNHQVYTLKPNSPLYIFPIPADEINLSGIEQNKR